MVKIYTRFQTNTAQRTIPFGAAHTYIAYIGEYHPPGYGAILFRDVVTLKAIQSQKLDYRNLQRILLLLNALADYNEYEFVWSRQENVSFCIICSLSPFFNHTTQNKFYGNMAT